MEIILIIGFGAIIYVLWTGLSAIDSYLHDILEEFRKHD